MNVRTIIGVVLFAALAGAVQAEGRRTELDSQDIAIIETSVFAHAHPDLRFRLSALSNLELERFAAAREDLVRASRYGDKASQALLAESYWEGTYGLAQNRALAYAWMDLAAERGYPLLVAKREAYWAQLSDEEQRAAIVQGQAIYAEFGDAVALPRLAQKLRHGRSEQTGTRTGSNVGTETFLADGSPMVINFLHRMRGQSVRPMPPRGGKRVDLWNDKFWKLDDYIAWKAVEVDGHLSGASGGSVSVLPIEPVESDL